MSFSENLREAMYCKNMTARQLAELSGIGVDTINSYLKTKSSLPKVDKAVRLAEILGVSAEFLVNGFDLPAASPRLSGALLDFVGKFASLQAREQEAVRALVERLLPAQ